MQSLKNFLLIVTRHPLSLTGSILTTSSAFLFFALFILESTGLHSGLYVGILSFIILPMLFVGGLLMIPAGIWLERRKPPTDLVRPERRNRRVAYIFFAATVANIGILAIASYKGYHVMESTSFCGTTCHTVMEPEYTAYLRSDHARVPCIECHVGAGAGWFVKSKLTGSRQLISVLFNLYPTPINVPVHNLRPARETCEQCHWPEKFVGDRLKVISRFKEDEKNTETKTVLLMHIGGVGSDRSHGIHWHVDHRVKIRYQSDPKRENIYKLELQKEDGSLTSFTSTTNTSPDPKATWKDMDCIDCHNRPTHVFRAAKDEIDLALSQGSIDRTLPFIRKQGLQLLKASYDSVETAKKEITMGLANFYAEKYPVVATGQKSTIDSAAAVLSDLYSKNIFPKMKVTWGTYANHLGHENSPGCTRCHDGNLKSASGKTVPDDCDPCHAVLATEEENPSILTSMHP